MEGSGQDAGGSAKGRVRRWRYRHLLLACVLGVLALLGVAWGLLQTPWLSVERVVVRGVAGTKAHQVMEVSGLGDHPTMISVNAAALRGRLDGLPWVKQAVVGRDWPSTVTITVSTRRPVATVLDRYGKWAVVDPTGRVIGQLASRPDGLPAFGGISGVPSPGRWLPGRDEPLEHAAALLPVDLIGVVKTIAFARVTQPGFPSGWLLTSMGLPSGPVTAVLGTEADLPAKYESLETLVTGGDLSGVSTVDVATPSLPVTSDVPVRVAGAHEAVPAGQPAARRAGSSS